MPQYTYDPTQGKVVPLDQARSITYISNDPEGIPTPGSAAASPYNVRSTAGDELLKKQGAANAVAAAQGAGISTVTGASAVTDSQNAARLEAAKAYALSPAGIRAALDKITADETARLTKLGGANTDSQNAAKVAVVEARIKAEAAMAAAAANPGNSPDAKRDQAAAVAAQKALTAAITASGSTTTVTVAPSAVSGTATATSTATATPIYGAAQGANAEPQLEITQEIRDATKGLDTNEGFIAGAVGARQVTGIPEDYITVNGILNFRGTPFSGQYGGKYYTDGKAVESKGAAWVWDGKAFVQPPMPQDGKTYTWDNTKGWIASTLNTATITATQTDSIAGITALLGSYGIGDLGDAITKAIINGYSPDTIMLIMQDPNSNDPLAVAFQKRFPANKVLAGQGKAVLSPGEYLAAERRYTEIMQSYGVSGLATRATLSEFIGNSISATEVSDRIGLAVNRVQNADAETKKMLATYYPMLNTNDIVTAMLNPKEGLPALQRKVQIAEIGGAALAQGLNTSLNDMSMKSNLYSNVQSGALGAQGLAELGVTKEQARLKYEQVAEITPRAEFLSAISPGEDYSRLQAEQEAFLGMASAKRARENLVKQEQGRFAGSAGTSKASLTSSTKGMLY